MGLVLVGFLVVFSWSRNYVILFRLSVLVFLFLILFGFYCFLLFFPIVFFGILCSFLRVLRFSLICSLCCAFFIASASSLFNLFFSSLVSFIDSFSFCFFPVYFLIVTSPTVSFMLSIIFSCSVWWVGFSI